MAKNEKRVHVTLACEVCKRRNYITMKNKQNDRERIELRQVLPLRPPPHAAQRDPLGPVRAGTHRPAQARRPAGGSNLSPIWDPAVPLRVAPWHYGLSCLTGLACIGQAELRHQSSRKGQKP